MASERRPLSELLRPDVQACLDPDLSSSDIAEAFRRAQR